MVSSSPYSACFSAYDSKLLSVLSTMSFCSGGKTTRSRVICTQNHKQSSLRTVILAKRRLALKATHILGLLTVQESSSILSTYSHHPGTILTSQTYSHQPGTILIIQRRIPIQGFISPSKTCPPHLGPTLTPQGPVLTLQGPVLTVGV